MAFSRARSACSWWWVASLAMACSAPPVEAPLLTLRSVEPEVWTPGTRVAVHASGLPIGREGTLHLEGRTHRPGLADQPVDQTFGVTATAAGRAEALVDRELLDGLGGRGTFEGTLTVRFEGSDGASVFGRESEVRIDLEPETLGQRRSDPLAAQEAMAIFGAHLALPSEEAGEDEANDETPTLGVLARTDGPAANAGLRAGDRLVAVAGVRVRSWVDFRTPPDARHLPVRFARTGLRGERSAVLVRSATAALASEPAPLLPWVVVALLLALFGAPMRLGRRHLHRVRRHTAWEPASLFGSACLGLLGAALAVALWRLGPAANAIVVFALGFATAPSVGGAWRHVPAALFVGVAPALVGVGALEPTTWPVLRAPLLLAFFVTALLPLVHLEGARWRRAPRSVAIGAVCAAGLAAPSAPATALLVIGSSLVLGLLIVPERPATPRKALSSLGLAAAALAALVTAHFTFAHPPARAAFAEMAPALALVALVAMAAVTSTRARVRAPFGL